ncbi:MAG TPA: hypothetical protein VHQ69_02215, partial [Methylomirabilota bacterium]|jgi:hypothetical protein|nr:hypothetical protein [Methylomirabilota bacterium]
MRRLGGRRTLVRVAGLLALAGCSRAYVAPVLPSAYTERIEAPYDAVWRALVRALARENVQIRTIARDSGVIASEAVPTTIGLYADCGRFGDERVQGDAQVAFTIFVESVTSGQTAVQVNTRMRTDTYTRGSGLPKPRSGLPCASTGRWEANLLDTVRALLRP